VSTPSGNDTYAYDDRGHVVSASGPSGTSTYTYDADSELTARTDSAGSASFTYTNDRPATVTDPVTQAVMTYGYNTDGTVKSVSYSGGQTLSLGYDNLARIATDDLLNSASSPIASVHYGYDADDHVTAKTMTGLAGAAANTYGYDKLGRLTWWTANAATATYGYDDASNRTRVNTTTATFDERNQQLTSGSTSFTYTPRGTLNTETTAGVTKPYQFDAFDRMTANGTQTYTYDGLDRPLSAPGQTFTYDGTSSAVASDGTQKFGRGSDGDLLSYGQGSTARLVLSDLHTDVIATFDATAGAATSPTSSNTYDPWGQVIASAGAGANLGYQGAWTDPTSGAVAMGARWYDTGRGAFDSRDSLPYSGGPSSDANGYLYVGGDPMSLTDPSGHYREPAPGPIPSVDLPTWATTALDNGKEAVKKFPLVRLATSGIDVEQRLSNGESLPSALGNTAIDLVPGYRWALNTYGKSIVEMANGFDELFTMVQSAAQRRVYQQYAVASLINNYTTAIDSETAATNAYTDAVNSEIAAANAVTATANESIRTSNQIIAKAKQLSRQMDSIQEQLDTVEAQIHALNRQLTAMVNFNDANARALELVRNHPITVSPAATQPTGVVAADPSIPARAIQQLYNLTGANGAATQAIYDAALQSAGPVVINVTTASQTSVDSAASPSPDGGGGGSKPPTTPPTATGSCDPADDGSGDVSDQIGALRNEFNTTVRPQYWMNQAASNPSGYSVQNLARMALGKAPFGIDGFPMELHHINPLGAEGSNDFSNLQPMTRTDHRLGANYRINHPLPGDC
jgi:RHS repeat-associated protein